MDKSHESKDETEFYELSHLCVGAFFLCVLFFCSTWRCLDGSGVSTAAIMDQKRTLLQLTPDATRRDLLLVLFFVRLKLKGFCLGNGCRTRGTAGMKEFSGFYTENAEKLKIWLVLNCFRD